MTETATESGSGPSLSAGPPAATGPHLAGYPVRLPKLTDPRLHLASVVITLQVLGQLVFDFNLSIAQILVSVGTCAVIEFVRVFRTERVIAWPASAMLTGNGIALIMRVPGTEHGDWWSLHGWWVFAGTAALGMFSKYVVRYRGRHIFNPSNVALVVAFVVLGEERADPQILWWGPLSFGLVLAFAVILAGSIAITRRVKQGHNAVSFWVVFAACTAVIAASGHGISANWHVGPVTGWDYWILLVTSPEILVFLFFMITDPKTSPRGRVGQTVFGTMVALSAALIVASVSGEFGTKVGILAGLVIACPFVRVIEARCPAPGSDEDHVGQWLASWLWPDRGTHRAVRPAVAVLAVGALVAVLVSVGPSPQNIDLDLSARSTVRIDRTTLPPIDVDNSLASVATPLDASAAEEMVVDLLIDLELERRALIDGNRELAAAATAGIRLEQARAAIDAVLTAAPPSYTFAAATARFVRIDSGPQTPPEPAVHAIGEMTHNGVTSPFEGTFVLGSFDGVHLLVNQLDASGDPVGAQRREGSSPAIEAALAPSSRPATSAELAGLRFRDVTEEAGLASPRSARALREGVATLSGGGAVGDYDGDGAPDLYLTRVGLPDSLYRNVGGRFVDVTAEAGLAEAAAPDSTGAIWVDLDGDRSLDLVIVGLGDTPHRVMLGQPDGTFRDGSSLWSMFPERSPNEDTSALGVTAGDYDRDGLVDLLITDVEPYRVRSLLDDAEAPGGSPCEAIGEALANQPRGQSRTRLLRNTGAGFENATDRLGIDPSLSIAMTARFIDLDGDGWQDVVIAGSSCTSRVLRNDRQGGFEDITLGSGADAVEDAAGTEFVDLNGDGLLDWIVSGISYPTRSGTCPLQDRGIGCSGNRVMLSNGDGTFEDATDEYGLRDGFWAWGVVAEDLNLDGYPDVMMTNGLATVVTERPDDGSLPDYPLYERSLDSPDMLWLGTEQVPSPQVAEQVGLTNRGNGKAAIPLDYDSDGLIDILVIDTDGTPTLFRNETRNAHHWIAIELVDESSANWQAIGSLVEVEPGGSVPKAVRRVGPAGSFQSGRSTVVHAGTGTRSTVERIVVTWPDGTQTIVADVTTEQIVRIAKGR